MTRRTRIVDEDASVKATVLDYAGSNPLAVRLTDTAGDYVSAGGGTQYTEGDTDATITGTAMMMEGAANALVAAQGTAADGLLVNLGTNNDVTVSGTVTANLAAGTNNIGDVDVLTVPAPLSTTGGGTEATALRVTLANDSTGVVSVDDNGGSITVDGTVAVTNAGTFAVQDSQVVADNGGFTDGTSKVFVAGYIYDEVAGTALTENDAAAARINVNRALVHAIEDGVTRGRYATVSAANALKVDGSAVTQPVSGTVTANLAAGTNNIGDVDVLTVPADPFGVNADAASATGSISAKLRFIASTGIPITGTVTVGSHAVTNAGTFAVQAAGDVAHDTADSGTPVKIGAKAETSPKGITLVADGDRTDLLADADGMQMVKIGTSNADLVSEYIAATGGTSTAFTNFSAVASTRNYVTAIHIYNSSATAGFVDFRDGAAGATLFTAAAPAGGGMVISNAIPLFKTSANTALAYDVSGALTTVYINVSGFQSKA